MATELEDKQEHAEGDQSPDRAQSYYDREFNAQTHPDNYSQHGSEPESADSLRGSEEGGGLYNSNGDKSSSKSDLRSAESGGASNTSQGSDNTQKSDPDQVGKGFTGSGKSGKKGLKGRLKSLRSKKALLIAAGGGGGVIIPLVLLLLFASSLKIPDLAQNITTFEFARLTRQFSESAERSSEEALADESTSDGLHGLLAAKYSGFRDSTWGRLDKYRPSQVQKTLGTDDAGVGFNEGSTALGRTYLKSVTLDGKEYAVEQVGGLSSFVPGIRQYKQFKNNVNFVKDFAPDLEKSLDASEAGPIVRGAVANNVRKEAGIGLIAWVVGTYQGKTPSEADLQANRDANKAVTADSTNEPTGVGPLDKAEDDVTQDTQQAVSDDKKLAAVIADGGAVPAATADLTKDVETNTLSRVVGLANPVYRVALPACIIYQGSLDKAGPTIDNQTEEQQRAYYFVASAGDQQKQGSETGDEQGGNLATAIGATSDKLGDTTQSNAEIRASGGSVDTSATGLSTEASPLGDYTLFNLIPGFGGSAVGNTVAGLASKGCTVATNIYVAIGTGVAVQIGSIIGDIFTGGALTGGEVAAEGASDAVVDATSTSIVDRLTATLSDKFASTFSKDGAKDIAVKLRSTLGIKNLANEGTKVTGLVGLSVLAKLIVTSKANQNYNGLEQGPDFANEADSGGNIQAGELSRSQMFGRPLTDSELASSDQADQQQMAYDNASQSFSQRYFATSNADSLVSHLALDISDFLKPGVVAALAKLGGTILMPIHSLSHVFSMMDGKVHAAPDPSTEYYGNVQFGWSEAEEKLVDSSNSYLPLENQAAFSQELNEKGLTEDTIAQQFATCFGYKYVANSTDDSFDPTDVSGHMVLDSGVGGSGSLGTLLTDPGAPHGLGIQRNSNGDIIGGNCSPTNLGPNNPSLGDLVFRWRLLESYNTTLDQLTNDQSVTN